MAKARQVKPELIPLTEVDGSIIYVNPFNINSVTVQGAQYIIEMNDHTSYRINIDDGDNESGINSIE